MKKLSYIILAVFAVIFWQFCDIKSSAQKPAHIQISVSSSLVYAQGTTTGTSTPKMSFLSSVLTGSSTDAPWFDTIYSFSRGLLNIVLLVFLIYVAFRNILNAGIDNYGIKRILPKLIAAAFIGNLVKPIVAVASRIVDSIINSQTTVFKTPATWDWYGAAAGGGLKGELLTLGSHVGSLVLGIFALMTPLTVAAGLGLLILTTVVQFLLVVGMLLIALFHILAPWIVLVATAVGPVAIGLSILPETESVYKKWLKILAFWLVFPLLLNVVYYFITLIPSIKNTDSNGNVSDIIGKILPTVVRIGLYSLAIRMPFTWEKDVGGMIAALPQTVGNTFNRGLQPVKKAADFTGRAVVAGRDWEQKIRERASIKAAGEVKEPAQGRAVSAWDAANAGGLNSATTDRAVKQSKKEIKGAQSDAYRELLMDDDHAVEREKIFKNQRPTHEKMMSYYQRYLDGDLAGAAAGTQDAAARDFFQNGQNATRVARKSKVGFIRDHVGQEMMEAAEQTDRTVTGDLKVSATTPDSVKKEARRFAIARGLQKWSVSSFASNWAAKQELYQAEQKKAGFRFDYLGRKVAGPIADIKSQTARKDDDFSRVKSTEKVANQMKDTIGKMSSVMQAELQKHSAGNIDLKTASVYLMKTAEKFDEAAESTYRYAAQFYGRQKGDQKINANDVGTLIAGHNRLRDLAAQEARSVVPIDEQMRLRESRLAQVYTRLGGGSGAVAPAYVGGRPAPFGAPSAVQNNPNYVPLGTRQIRDGLNKINQTLNSTGGTNALNGLRREFASDDFRHVTIDDFNAFNGENEGIAQEIGRAVAAKSDQGTADQFVNKLKLSRGLNTRQMEQDAARFGDPQISRMVVDYNRRQKMELVVLSKSEEARALQGQAGQFVAKAQANPEIIKQIRSSIETYVKTFNRDQSVTPSQGYAAKQYLAGHMGLSDGNAVTQRMVADLARQLQVTTIRNPGER